MQIPDRFRIHETDHWLINHRIDSALPGYLIMGSTDAGATDLAALDDAALTSFGPLLAKAQRALHATLAPQRIYVTRYGHTPGYPVHFHLVPISGWVMDRYHRHARGCCEAKLPAARSDRPADGCEVSLFVSRAFCGGADNPPIMGPTIDEVITLMRDALHDLAL